MASILIIDSDIDFTHALTETLHAKGHRADTVPSVLQGIDKLDGSYDLILLDVNLSDSSSLDSLSAILKKGENSKFLVMSTNPQDKIRIARLNGEAMDFILKPFTIPVLNGIIDSYLHTWQRSVNPCHNIGRYHFYPAEKRLKTADGNYISLTKRECDILQKLINTDGPVDRKTFLKEVWGYNERVSTHTVETHIYRLRQKIEINPSKPELLVTIGTAYALAA